LVLKLNQIHPHRCTINKIRIPIHLNNHLNSHNALILSVILLKDSVSHLLPVHNVIIHSVLNVVFMMDSMQNYIEFSQIVKYLNLSEFYKPILPRTRRGEGIYPTNQKCFSDENQNQKKKKNKQKTNFYFQLFYSFRTNSRLKRLHYVGNHEFDR
jgi:hypothetical protein